MDAPDAQRFPVPHRSEPPRAFSEADLRDALAASHTGTFRWDIRTDAFHWDATLDRLLGRPPGRTARSLDAFLALVHPEDVSLVRSLSERCAREGADLEMDFRVVRPGERPVWLYAKGRTLPGEDGRPAVVTGACVEVTGRKKIEASLRESEERFRTLADNIAQFTWMTDETGWIFWYNRRWFEYTGTTLEQMEGWGWQKVHHPDHADRVVSRFRQAIEAGETWEDTFPLRARDGTYRWFLSRAIPIRDDEGHVLRWFGTNTDITDRMRMEQALRESDRRKDEFLATLAHELRNPLAPIRTGLELLRAAGSDLSLREKVQDTLERQTRQLVRLVDDLLDLSRITRGTVELRREDVEIANVVRSAVETSQPVLDRAGHTLAVTLPDSAIFLHADPTRLAQVLSNLLNNAAKYTPEPGRIELSVERQGDEVVLSVRDPGEGIPAELLGSIFEMFVQARGDAGRPHTGLGIGLTLVKSLVEMHGGGVGAHSAGPGQGSEFTIRLPVRPAAAAERSAPAQPSAANGRLHILIADDNRDAADTLRILLERRGHRVDAVFDGAAAAQAATELRPDVVLLDLGMPHVDGYEVARRIRRAPNGGDTALIAVTGWGQESDRERTRSAGFDHHLVKPVDLAELEQLLAEAPQRDP